MEDPWPTTLDRTTSRRATQEDPEIARRQQDFTRRVLLRAGWVVPMVTTVNIPSASAQTPPPHNDVHGDAPHEDNIVEHLDVHLDSPVPPHDDHSDHDRRAALPTCAYAAAPTLPHYGRIRPHSDSRDAGPRRQPHGDAPHTDTPPTPTSRIRTTPPHTDTPRTDTPPHTDDPAHVRRHTDHVDTRAATRDHADAATHLDNHGDRPRRAWRFCVQ